MSYHPKDHADGATVRLLDDPAANRLLYTAGNVGPSGRPIPLDPDALLDEAETAFLLRTTPRTQQAWRLRGGGPAFVKLGKRRGVRYRRGTVVQYSIGRERHSISDSRWEGR
jgi:hypothetical protein